MVYILVKEIDDFPQDSYNSKMSDADLAVECYMERYFVPEDFMDGDTHKLHVSTDEGKTWEERSVGIYSERKYYLKSKGA